MGVFCSCGYVANYYNYENVGIERCDNCNYSEEVYFDGEKWKYRCENFRSPMAGDYVEGNWFCEKLSNKEDYYENYI